jgi:hypothetical protein
VIPANKKLIQNMHKQYIIGTDYKAVVKDKEIILCCLTNAVIEE